MSKDLQVSSMEKMMCLSIISTSGKHKDEKGAILISSGRTEAALKFKELIFDLYSLGYSVYILDNRGQGLSGKMTEDREMGYVDNFQYYIDDMKMFFDSEIKNENHQNVYLLAHSLGGTIGMFYLEQYPDDFDAAAFSAPFVDISFPTSNHLDLIINVVNQQKALCY